jgi:protease I
MSARLARPTLVVIAQTGFQDVELSGTLAGLKNKQIEYVLSSKNQGVCQGKYGGQVDAAVAWRDVDENAYQAVAFIGGPGAGVLKDDKDVLQVAKKFMHANKLIGAICIAPTILAQAGVLEGKRATVWCDANQTQAKFLESHGATYTGTLVEVCDNVVTGNGPEAAEAFGQAFASMVNQ